MSLNLRRLMCGDVSRLRYVLRFSTCRVHHRESVAEHSFYVAFYAMVIADWVMWQSSMKDRDLTNIDFCELYRRAVVHDIEEARSGDFPRPFKYQSGVLKIALDEAAGLAARMVIHDFFPDEDSAVAVRFNRSWIQAKHLDTEGAIVAFADFLSVLSFFFQEGRDGSATLYEHSDAMRVYLDTFADSKFDFLRPLIDEAQQLTEEIFDGSGRPDVVEE